jgi:hypothetical protein
MNLAFADSPDLSTIAQMATIIAPVVTTCAVIVALFSAKLQKLFSRANLKAETTTAYPFITHCPIRDAGQRFADSYWARVRVSNDSDNSAECLTAYLEGVKRWNPINQRFAEVLEFLPGSLLWSDGEGAKETQGAELRILSPGAYRFLDIFAIVNPAQRAQFNDRSLLNDKGDEAIIDVALVHRNHAKTYLIPPGRYQLDLLLSGKNTRPQQVKIEISASGNYVDQPQEMLGTHLSIAIVEE